jgi:hypothetical protein
MKKTLLLGVSFMLFSCNDREVQLTKSNITIVAEVKDHSPVYIFFVIKNKDTLAEVNRKNTISTTNWLFNIDKRLPLHIVMPEIVKLQEKKENGRHKSDIAQNFYTYADTVSKNLAFIPFQKTTYKFQKPTKDFLLVFGKNNTIKLNNKLITKEELVVSFSGISNAVYLCFAKELSFEKYLENRIFIHNLKLSTLSDEEYIY